MDFFEQQRRAKRLSWLALALFSLVIAAIGALFHAGVYLLWWFMYITPHHHRYSTSYYYHNSWGQPPSVEGYLGSPVFWVVCVLVAILFLAGSIRRWRQMRRSSVAIADLIGAVEISATDGRGEQQLINVVEEMAVASSTPVPRLFVLRNEPGINAFVSGTQPRQMMVVTQGAIDHLTRDELQGLVAHEFGHLFNGDTQLNMRIMILFAGLQAIGRMGYNMLSKDKLANKPRFRPINHRNISQRESILLQLRFLGMLFVGYPGLFFARLVKANVIRQREALADAGAHQFTRNPEGLAGAIMKMDKHGSVLRNPFAEDINHMCFGNGVSTHFKRLLASHPESEDRLAQIDTRWVARARVRQRRQSAEKEAATAPPNPLGDKQLGYAQQYLAAIPGTVRQRLKDPQGACLVIYALIVDLNKSQQLPGVNENDKLMLPILVDQLQDMGKRSRIPLIDLALPAIQRLDEDASKQFLATVDKLIKADGKINLFEFLLRQLIHHRVRPPAKPKTHFSRLNQVARDVQVVLSALILSATSDQAAQQKLFTLYAAPLLPKGRLLLPANRCFHIKTLAQSIKRLGQLNPFLKRSLTNACADIARDDGVINTQEIQLVRLICLLADCPIPQLEH